MIVKKFGGIPLLWELFFVFFKIGLFTFGGGYAMISVIEDLCVEKHRWITHQDMATIVTVAESTPGPIAINGATFVGYRRGKLPGAIAATLGVITPSFLIIFLISMFLDNFLEITIVAHAFQGIKIAVGILILNAAVTMIRSMEKEPLPLVILISMSGVFLLGTILGKSVSTIALILCAAAVGMGVTALRKGGDTK